LADQELGEVPLDRFGAQDARGLLDQPLVQRVGIAAIDIDLGHHGEAHPVIELAERGNFIVRARVLRSKLVAWETQHHQPLVRIALPQLFQAFELRREAALAGRVDDQQDLAFVF